MHPSRYCVKHLPLDRDSDRAKRKREHAKLMTDAQWRKHREDRDERRAVAIAMAGAEVGSLSEREVLLLGAAIYWCEGAKGKPWRPADKIVFMNSDAGLIALFLRFLARAGVGEERVSFRLHIHETADVKAAEAWWVDRLHVGKERSSGPPSSGTGRPPTAGTLATNTADASRFQCATTASSTGGLRG
jgi:hypothetical protein